MRRGILLVSLVVFAALACFAEELNGQDSKGIVWLTKHDVNYTPKTRQVRVEIAGETLKLPPGSRVTVLLKYNYFEVGSCTAEMRPDGSFGTVVLNGDVKLPPDTPYQLYVTVLLDKQPERLREKVKKILNESVVMPVQAEFSLGTEAQREKERREVKEFVTKLLKALIKVNNRFAGEIKAARDGVSYQKEGTFDPQAWREFLDDNWRRKVIELQKRFAKWNREHPAYKFRYGSGVRHLWEMLKIVAFRSVVSSRKLYRKWGLKTAVEDATLPRDFKADPKWTSVRTEKRAREKLGQFYKVVDGGFDLGLTKKKKKGKDGKKGEEVRKGEEVKKGEKGKEGKAKGSDKKKKKNEEGKSAAEDKQ